MRQMVLLTVADKFSSTRCASWRYSAQNYSQLYASVICTLKFHSFNFIKEICVNLHVGAKIDNIFTKFSNYCIWSHIRAQDKIDTPHVTELLHKTIPRNFKRLTFLPVTFCDLYVVTLSNLFHEKWCWKVADSLSYKSSPGAVPFIVSMDSNSVMTPNVPFTARINIRTELCHPIQRYKEVCERLSCVI